MRSNCTGFRIVVWFLLFVLVIFHPSCRKEEPQSGSAVDESAEDSSDIAVTINGHDIMENQVKTLIQPAMEALSTNSSQVPPAVLEGYKQQIRQQALEQLILRHLLDEKVKDANIVVSEEEVLSEMSKVLLAEQPPISLEQYKQKLAENGGDFELEKEQITKVLGYQKLMEPYWEGKIDISDDEVQKYYDENQIQFQIPEQVRASHILISVKEDDPNETRMDARTKIEALLGQLRAGADFAELARANSDCPSAENGGDLDYFLRGAMVEPFDKVAFELEPGEISDIVETVFGYHIIQVTDHKDAETIPFEKVKDQITKQLSVQRQNELFQEYIQSLKDKANIVYPADKEPQ